MESAEEIKRVEVEKGEETKDRPEGCFRGSLECRGEKEPVSLLKADRDSVSVDSTSRLAEMDVQEGGCGGEEIKWGRWAGQGGGGEEERIDLWLRLSLRVICSCHCLCRGRAV